MSVLCITAILSTEWQRWVKTRNTQREHMFSGVPPKADSENRAGGHQSIADLIAKLLLMRGVRITAETLAVAIGGKTKRA
jgi:hypothetical protein